MSDKPRKAGDAVYQGIYGPFKNNPAGNRLSLEERMYIRILSELSCNRFKWVGLPDSVDERFLELALFNQALCVFFFDEQYDRYFALRASGSGTINMYDNPTTFTVTGNTILNKRLNAGNTWKEGLNEEGVPVQTMVPAECVPIWGNYMRIPDKDIIYVYASQLANLHRTIEINSEAMRHPTVITTNENNRLTWVNLMRQHRNGEPIIFGTNGLDLSQAQAFNIGPDKDTLLNLMIAKGKVWNECMTLLGINNVNQDKKERMVSSEVEGNDEQVVVNSGIALNSRKIACEQINARYGLSLDVGWNPQAKAMAAQYAVVAGVA